MGSNFEHLSDTRYPLDPDPPTSIDPTAFSVVSPDNSIHGWSFDTYTSSSVPDYVFDAMVLSPTLAPTYGSYAALVPLPHHCQGLNSTRQSLSSGALSFATATDSLTPQSQQGMRCGSEALSPETACSLESIVSTAVTDGGFSLGDYHEVPTPPRELPNTASSRSKRPLKADDERHTAQEKTVSSNTKKKRKGKDESQTEAPARTSKSRSSKDTASKQAAPAKSNGKTLAQTAGASRRRGEGSREGILAASLDGEPQTATQRERNRMAATRCRAKTKAAVQQLEIDERSIADHRDILATTRDSLRAEVLHYRSLLLQHQDCNCSHIRQYLGKAAELIAKTGGQHPIWGKTGEGGEWADYQEPCELGHDVDDFDEEEDEEEYELGV